MDILEALTGALAEPPRAAPVRALVTLCHRMALLYIRKKARAGSLHIPFFGLSTSDLALDCVSTLFSRDADGRFHHLRTYYAGAPLSTLATEELLAVTRRLVFSAVNQQIYRLLKEEDPSLDKLLRNLRAAARKTPRVSEERRGGELWICTEGETERTQMLPSMPPEFLDALLSPELRHDTSLRDVVRQLGRILETQSVYRKSCRLVALALTVRAAYARFGRDETDQTRWEETGLRHEEIMQMIDQSVESVGRRMHDTYVHHHHLGSDEFGAYLQAVRDALRNRFLDSKAGSNSLFQHLKRHLPALTPDQYRGGHRCHMEYLLRLARKDFFRQAAGELAEVDV